MLAKIVIFALIGVACNASYLRTVHNNRPRPHDGGDPGQALFLTPLIEEGQYELARNLSRVGTLNGDNVESYAGFFTVNKTYDSNLFFWFFPAMKDPQNAPILLWLQGGPGGSSLFGLFVESGPYHVTADQMVKIRNTTWASKFNIMYIDNPVGTGFSFTKNDAGYATNEDDVGRDLFNGLQQFFTAFPQYAKNDFYITGESYAGKYVPAASYYIHKNRDVAVMNFKGMAIGDGLCDPYTMLDYASFLQSIGLLDDLQALHFRNEQAKAKKCIENADYMCAFHVFDELLNGDKLNGSMPYFKNITGLDFYYNFLLTKEPAEFEYYNTFVQTSMTRRAIHVGNLTYNDGSKVEDKLEGDVMKSVKPWIAELMNNYRVMIYNGQLDIIIAAPLTANFVSSIPWDGSNDLQSTDRIIWYDAKHEPAGYVRQVKNFTEVLVRNAGHILPYDQPQNALDMMDRFINNKSWRS